MEDGTAVTITNSCAANVLGPVSYTHLMWFAQLGMIVAIPITIKFFLPIYSKLDIDTAYHYLEIRFGSKGPVSYTHLDVYKRQALFRSLISCSLCIMAV